MGQLKQWVKDNSNFLKLGDGESFQGRYLGYSFLMNQDGKEVPAFKFQDVLGHVKVLQSQSTALCDAFDEDEGKFKKGDFIKLTRHGKEKQTKYVVEAGDIIM